MPLFWVECTIKFTGANMENDYKVADMGLADFGRREISLAENEMPALMALRTKYKDAQPLKGAKVMGCIHMTCLLYTSPSPRDRQKSRMPSSA